ncbi:hypothetical protein AKJ61_00770 [candidate division MSBL1 archaeon SCGC-AAA259B11]|uniref:ATPase dynein-related AAA domain-containing protein n=1 Tax=candidate division MSBL1 archaeon SCGC-AAA259B11 TaxID=1698260 RepID=A0A133U899_9EURY|nr:hypothetical protein AKJ61_00770 [candidate division MSBL1 archaeon SCGC-AAA259B11]
MNESGANGVPNSGSSTTIGRAKDIIKSLIAGHLEGADIPSVMLWGPPGIGKTAIVDQAAEELEIDVERLILSQHDEVDLMGLPHETNGTVEWTRPVFIPEEGQGVMHLDELTQARESVMAPAQQLVHERRVGPHELGDEWYIVASTNRLCDRAQTNPIAAQMANRFLNYEVETTLEDWKKWAYSNGINPVVIAFHEHHKGKLLFKFEPERMEAIRGFPTPRTWEYVSNLMEVGQTSVKAIAGAVGEGAAREFDAFRRMREDLPDIDEILEGKDIVPEKPEILHMVVSSVTSATIQELPEIGHARRAFKYAMQLPSEFATLLGKNIMREEMDEKVYYDIVGTDEFTEYSEEYKEVISPDGRMT